MTPGRTRVRREPLEPGRERELIARADSGDRAAARELVEAFLPAIWALARRFESAGGVQRTELLDEGVAGLLFAVKRYDPRTGTPFWAYASFWVRKAMQELVAEMTRPVALTNHAVRGLAHVKAARRDYVQVHGGEPTNAELAEATGLPEAQIDSLLASDRAPRSFDEPLGPSDDTTATFGETVADPNAENAFNRVLDRMEIQTVRTLADRLSERERAVLEAHYGIGRPAQTLAEIGSSLGLTAERCRQIEQEALATLRAAAARPSRPR
jgi:RNA polymerase sigma factor (sigma-70 family)